jgi:hypothetical protein
MATDALPPRPTIRCTFFALRGADLLFKRSIDLVDVPRVGERIQMWFTDAANIRGNVRDVRWTIPKTGPPTVNIQVELSPGDRPRFANRTPMNEPPDG